MDPFLLGTVPPQLMVQCFQKFKPKEFTRTFRTCKLMRDVAEAGKSKIRILLREEDRVVNVKIQIENEHPEDNPLLTLIHLNVSKKRKGDAGRGMEKSYILSTAQLAAYIQKIGLSFFRIYELNIFANRLKKNQQVTLPIIGILFENKVTCYKLAAPTCDWVQAAVEATHPLKWCAYSTFANTTLQGALPKKVDTLRVKTCISIEKLGDFFFLLEKCGNLSVRMHVDFKHFINQLGHNLQQIYSGRRAEQQLKLRCNYNKRMKLVHIFSFPVDHYKRLPFAYGKRKDDGDMKKSRPDIFIAEMEEQRKLIVVTFRNSIYSIERFLFIRYKVLSTWNEFEDFMYEIFFISEQDFDRDVKLLKLKREHFSE